MGIAALVGASIAVGVVLGTQHSSSNIRSNSSSSSTGGLKGSQASLDSSGSTGNASDTPAASTVEPTVSPAAPSDSSTVPPASTASPVTGSVVIGQSDVATVTVNVRAEGLIHRIHSSTLPSCATTDCGRGFCRSQWQYNSYSKQLDEVFYECMCATTLTGYTGSNCKLPITNPACVDGTVPCAWGGAVDKTTGIVSAAAGQACCTGDQMCAATEYAPVNTWCRDKSTAFACPAGQMPCGAVLSSGDEDHEVDRYNRPNSTCCATGQACVWSANAYYGGSDSSYKSLTSKCAPAAVV